MLTDSHRNLLLDALPKKERDMLRADFEFVHLRSDLVLHESGHRVSDAYFPTTAVLSLQQSMEDGATIETASVGREGMTGLPILTGGETMPARVSVQTAGFAYRINANNLRIRLDASSVLSQLLLRYTHALLAQVAQTAGCNRHHALSKQVCRWLLLNIDRTQSSEITLTQQTIADTLGVRREGITNVLRQLHDSGIVRRARGCIEILDRSKLEAGSCECYHMLRSEFARMHSAPNI